MERGAKVEVFLIKLAFFICYLFIVFAAYYDHGLSFITNMIWGTLVLFFVNKEINQIDS